MLVTPTALVEGSALTDSEADYYTVPDECVCAGIGDISFINTSAADVTVSAYAVPVGDSSGVANAIVKAFTLPPGIPQNFSMRRVINPGTTIKALASSASVVSFSVSGVVVTA